MCLQWCHVRDCLIDNDIPCERLCPAEIRLARAGNTCATCRHRRGEICCLTQEHLPSQRWCCHHNAEVRKFEKVLLRTGQNVPWELLAAHGVASVRDLFGQVESAPELPPEAPADGIWLEAEALSVPLVYGVCAACWEAALTGEEDEGCTVTKEIWS